MYKSDLSVEILETMVIYARSYIDSRSYPWFHKMIKLSIPVSSLCIHVAVCKCMLIFCIQESVTLPVRSVDEVSGRRPTYSHISWSTQGRELSDVDTARSYLLAPLISSSTSTSTPRRKFSLVHTVTKSFTNCRTSKNTQKSTQDKRTTLVTSVRSVSSHDTTWSATYRLVKELRAIILWVQRILKLWHWTWTNVGHLVRRYPLLQTLLVIAKGELNWKERGKSRVLFIIIWCNDFYYINTF